MKKLIYILNEYSNNSDKHYFHVINLLENIAANDVYIALIIEKPIDIPVFKSKKITAYPQTKYNKFARLIELRNILNGLYIKGFNKVFIRISLNAAILSIITSKKKDVQTYFWQSGTNISLDRELRGLKKIRWLLKTYFKILYVKNKIDYFVTGPESMIEYYKNTLNIQNKRMKLLYNDIDTERFAKKQVLFDIRESLNIPKESNIILFVHRLTPIKGFHLSLPIIAENSLFENTNNFLVIIGDGPKYHQLQEDLKNSKNYRNIRMIGKIPNADISNYYIQSNVLINPSFSEGFPRVLLEAMASKIPIVAFDSGGSKEILGITNQKYIPQIEDYEKFNSALNEILNNQNVAEQIISENFIKVQKYDTHNVSKQYVEVLFYE